MPDYAGAKAAIRARLVAGWNTTPITYQNEQPGTPWPPVDANGVLLPWVHLEIVSTGSELIGASGKAGNRVWNYFGRILVHVFVPVGTADADATSYALQIGELFRAAEFYNATPGFAVRTLAPEVDDGDSSDDDGNWFRVTMSCPFTYWHRG